jgi:hypothetical protein
MISVSWIKCRSDGHYCDLELLDLKTITATTGVYVIWHEGNPARVVRIGQGNIATRLGAHRRVGGTPVGNLQEVWPASCHMGNRTGTPA